MNSLPVFAPDAAQSALAASPGQPISVAQSNYWRNGRAKHTISPLVEAAYTWTPITAPIPTFTISTTGAQGVSGLSFNFPNSAGGFSMNAMTDVQTLAFPNLTTIGGLCTFDSNPVLTSVNFPVLASSTATIVLISDPLLTSVLFPSLTTVTGASGIEIDSNVALATLSFPSLVTVSNGMTITGNTALTSLNLSALVPTNGKNYNFSGNALTLGTLDQLLAVFINASSYVSGTLNISGGTNAVLDAGALTLVAVLTGRGVTVTHN